MVSTGGTEGKFTVCGEYRGYSRAGSQCGEYRGYRGQVHNVVSTGGTEGRFTMW